MMQNSISPPQALEDAFYAFNEVSERLAEAYCSLQDRVSTLNDELAAARSDRIKQLAEKERLADRLQRLLEALPAGVVVLDSSGIVRDCNCVAMEILGGPLIGEPWLQITARAFKCFGEQGVVLFNGRRLSITARRLITEAGQILLLTDVSEAHAMAEMVNRNKRLSAMGEMVARLAHQIRTPLATALLYASNLSRAQLPENERIRGAEKVVSHLRQLERMVNDMLVFARGGEAALEDIPIAELLEYFRHNITLQIQACGGILKIVNNAEHAVISGSREALLGALLNLATNSIQACGTGARIVIAAHQSSDGAVQLRFSDNGPGIPHSLIERIFEPFFTTRNTGTGLGLAVVRSVVESHHGTIEVQSQPDAGASFTLCFPSATQEDGLPSGVFSYAASESDRTGTDTNTKSAQYI